MVSPRAPIGKRYGPSEQQGGVDYVDPFERFIEKQSGTEGWVSWVGEGVRWGVEGANAVVNRVGYGQGARQQHIPLDISKRGSSLEFDNFNDDHDIKEEARLVHNALAAFRDAEKRGDGNAELTEAEYAAWKRWESREAELRRIEEAKAKRVRDLEETKKSQRKVTVPLASLGGPGILVPGQGFVPIGGQSSPSNSGHLQNVSFPRPLIPNIPLSLIPGAARSTSSVHSTGTTGLTRRNAGNTSSTAIARDDDSDVGSTGRRDGPMPSHVAEHRDLWESRGA